MLPSDSDSSDEDEETQARRQRAMQLLAKVLKPKESSQASSTEEERRFLQSVLELKSHEEMVRSIRDRVSVLSVTGDSSSVTGSKGPRPAVAPTQEVPRSTRLRSLLECLQTGDVTGLSPRVLSAEFWRGLVPGLSLDGMAGVSREDSRFPSESLELLRQALHERGYGSTQPAAPGCGAGERWLEALELGARQLVRCGYPPVFIFCFDEAWAVIDSLFPPLQAVLGDGCRMDPSTFCWIARNGPAGVRGADGACPAGSDAPKAGQNFGMPHRDFTSLQSLTKEGSPALLSVWLPLTEVWDPGAHPHQ